MPKTSEPVLGLAVMQVLATRPDGEASVRILVQEVPNFVKLTASDHKSSEARPNEEMWERRVRNLNSHDDTPGNVVGEGFVQYVRKGTYRLTKAGWIHLKHKGLA